MVNQNHLRASNHEKQCSGVSTTSPIIHMYNTREKGSLVLHDKAKKWKLVVVRKLVNVCFIYRYLCGMYKFHSYVAPTVIVKALYMKICWYTTVRYVSHNVIVTSPMKTSKEDLLSQQLHKYYVHNACLWIGISPVGESMNYERKPTPSHRDYYN